MNKIFNALLLFADFGEFAFSLAYRSIIAGQLGRILLVTMALCSAIMIGITVYNFNLLGVTEGTLWLLFMTIIANGIIWWFMLSMYIIDRNLHARFPQFKWTRKIP